MDKSGSRPGISRQPLIIERPDLEHPVRRALSVCFTALAWFAWFVLWLPVLTFAAERFGIALPWQFPSGERNLQALQELIDVFPAAMGILLVVLAANGVTGWLYRRLHKPVTHHHVDTRQLASGMSLDELKLAAWQRARILRVQHSAEGRVIDADVVR